MSLRVEWLQVLMGTVEMTEVLEFGNQLTEFLPYQRNLLWGVVLTTKHVGECVCYRIIRSLDMSDVGSEL